MYFNSPIKSGKKIFKQKQSNIFNIFAIPPYSLGLGTIADIGESLKTPPKTTQNNPFNHQKYLDMH